MKPKLLSTVLAAALAVSLTASSALAQTVPPPVIPSLGNPVTGGGAFHGWGAVAVIGTATWFAVLNPKKGSDSIASNSIHGTWRCALDGKDPRPRCSVFNKLRLAERKRLYAQADAR